MAKKLKTATSSTSKMTIDGRSMKLKDGNFSVSVKGKKVKPTSQDTMLFNAGTKSAIKTTKDVNKMLPKGSKKWALPDTIKKKK